LCFAPAKDKGDADVVSRIGGIGCGSGKFSRLKSLKNKPLLERGSAGCLLIPLDLDKNEGDVFDVF